MLEKYSRPEMRAIWSKENQFRNWLEIELLVCEAMEKLEEIPEGVSKKLRQKASFDVKKIDQIEEEITHPVMAFLTNVTDGLGDEGRFLHIGITSSDVQDTGFALQLKQASDIMLEDIDKVLAALKKRIEEYKTTLCVGRSHGAHAEPTTFGMKLASHYSAFKRAKRRLKAAQKEVSVCSISGAVGTYSTIDPRVEEYVAERMGLSQEIVSSQVVPRDRHAMFFATLGVIAASIENLAIEIRLLQTTEVREVEEFFEVWDKGSTALPHKYNPVISENLTGLSRMIRSSVAPVLESVSLWHERDLSHSAVEDIVAPSATALIDYSLINIAEIIDKMIVHPERMIKNLEITKGLVFSQHVVTELVKGGMSRSYANKLVQQISAKVFESDTLNFFNAVMADETVLEYVEKDNLSKIFDYSRCLSRVSSIIDNAFSADNDEDEKDAEIGTEVKLNA